jgi:hypothetical protein
MCRRDLPVSAMRQSRDRLLPVGDSVSQGDEGIPGIAISFRLGFSQGKGTPYHGF